MRPVCSDALPIIGSTAMVTNVLLATGHVMWGMTGAVVAGKLIAELVTGRSLSVSVEPFSPDRF